MYKCKYSIYYFTVFVLQMYSFCFCISICAPAQMHTLLLYLCIVLVRIIEQRLILNNAQADVQFCAAARWTVLVGSHCKSLFYSYSVFTHHCIISTANIFHVQKLKRWRWGLFMLPSARSNPRRQSRRCPKAYNHHNHHPLKLITTVTTIQN